jgi:hypothetical protein
VIHIGQATAVQVTRSQVQAPWLAIGADPAQAKRIEARIGIGAESFRHEMN